MPFAPNRIDAEAVCTTEGRHLQNGNLKIKTCIRNFKIPRALLFAPFLLPAGVFFKVDV